jgi:hypothetical protein
MVANVVQSGTTSALTINSETQLFAAITTPGTYFVTVDTSNMANGDELELRIYVKLFSGQSEILYLNEPIAHAQGQPAKISVPIPTPISVRATLKQTAGTGRTYSWAVWGL